MALSLSVCSDEGERDRERRCWMMWTGLSGLSAMPVAVASSKHRDSFSLVSTDHVPGSWSATFHVMGVTVQSVENRDYILLSLLD